MKDFFRRLKALTHKEFLELIRDRSSLLMGILILPILFRKKIPRMIDA